MKVIYPQKQIIEHKGEQLLYYKNDTHWNLLGAYYAYIELMKRIKEDYNIQTYAIKGYITEKYNGDLYDMSPRLLRKSDDTIYAIPNIENYNSICKLSNEPRGIVNCFNRLGRYNLLMFRDSFSTSLIPYLSNSFKLSKYIWTYNVSPLAMENADVIILEIVERNIPTLINSHME